MSFWHLIVDLGGRNSSFSYFQTFKCFHCIFRRKTKKKKNQTTCLSDNCINCIITTTVESISMAFSQNALSKQKLSWWKSAPLYLPAILFLKYINLTVSKPKRLSDPSVFKGRTWSKENQLFSNSYLYSTSSKSSEEQYKLHKSSTVIKSTREQSSVTGQSKVCFKEEREAGGSSVFLSHDTHTHSQK